MMKNESLFQLFLLILIFAVSQLFGFSISIADQLEFERNGVLHLPRLLPQLESARSAIEKARQRASLDWLSRSCTMCSIYRQRVSRVCGKELIEQIDQLGLGEDDKDDVRQRSSSSSGNSGERAKIFNNGLEDEIETQDKVNHSVDVDSNSIAQLSQDSAADVVADLLAACSAANPKAAIYFYQVPNWHLSIVNATWWPTLRYVAQTLLTSERVLLLQTSSFWKDRARINQDTPWHRDLFTQPSIQLIFQHFFLMKIVLYFVFYIEIRNKNNNFLFPKKNDS